MKTLDDYLATVAEGVQRARVRATLCKQINADGLTTEANLVERFVRSGSAELKFHSMIGRKRDGMRLPTSPKWSIFSGDHGFGVSRTAALYANFLLDGKYDFEEIEARAKAEYKRAIEEARPPTIKHGW